MDRQKAIQAFESLCHEAETYAEAESRKTGVITSNDSVKRSRALSGVIYAIYPKEFASVIFQAILGQPDIRVYDDDWIDDLTRKFFSAMLYDGNDVIGVETTALTRIDSTRESLSTLAVFTSSDKDIMMGMIKTATAIINNDNTVRAVMFRRFAEQFYYNENGISITSLAECYRSVIIDGHFIVNGAMKNLKVFFEPMDQDDAILDGSNPDVGYVDPIKYAENATSDAMILVSKEDLSKKIQAIFMRPKFEQCTLAEVSMYMASPRAVNPKVLYVMSELSNELVGNWQEKLPNTACTHLAAMEKVLSWFPKSTFNGDNANDSIEKILADIAYVLLPGNRYKLKTGKDGTEASFIHILRKNEILQIVKSILQDHEQMAEDGKYTEPPELCLIYAIRDITKTIWGDRSIGYLVFSELMFAHFRGADAASVNAETITNLIWEMVPRGPFWWNDTKAIKLFRSFIGEEKGEIKDEQHQEKPVTAQSDDAQAAQPDDQGEHEQQEEKHPDNQDQSAVNFIELSNEALMQFYGAPDYGPANIEITMSSFKNDTGSKLLPQDIEFSAGEGENAGLYSHLQFKLVDFVNYVKACQKAVKANPQKIDASAIIKLVQKNIFPTITINGKKITPARSMLQSMMLFSEIKDPQDHRLPYYLLDKIPTCGPIHIENAAENMDNLEFSISKQDIVNLAYDIYMGAQKELREKFRASGIVWESGALSNALATSFIRVCYPNDSCIMYGSNAKSAIQSLFESLDMADSNNARETQVKLAMAIMMLIPFSMPNS